MQNNGILSSQVVSGKQQEGKKFSDYFDYAEAIGKIPSHRALALFRGRNEGVLNLHLGSGEAEGEPSICESIIAASQGIAQQGRAADAWLTETVRWAWRIKLSLKLELELLAQLRERAEEEAIRVFASNLHDLLLAAPAGPKATIGLDPGLRTGVKVAMIDTTGKVVATDTIYPHAPKKQWDRSIATLAAMAKQYSAELVAIGNGTASRETDKLTAELIKKHPELKLQKLMVSEAGASVYSASELASKEMPELDVSLRGAVSIARRLQDPLAELREDRTQSDRRRPVPARRQPEPPLPLPACGGGGLRQRCRGRPQYRLGAAAEPGLRPKSNAGGEHRTVSQPTRCL